MPTGWKPAVRTRSSVAVEVVDLERQVVRALAVTGEEALEEVVVLDVPRLEQLDVHALGLVAEAHLHRPEAGAVPAEEHQAAELADEEVEGGADVARREGDVVEIDVHRRSRSQISAPGRPA